MTVEAAQSPRAPLVVIADADDDARLILPAALRHAGYRCAPTANGEEALDLAERQGAALLITELYLPARGRRCVVHAVKHGSVSTSRLPVLVYTAHAMPEDRQWAFEAGCDVVLYKPTPVHDLLAAVHRLVVR